MNKTPPKSLDNVIPFDRAAVSAWIGDICQRAWDRGLAKAWADLLYRRQIELGQRPSPEEEAEMAKGVDPEE